MATTKQKTAARQNLTKARKARSTQAKSAPKNRSRTLRKAAKNDLPDSAFAFPKERKEPLTDARHVRNAIARFDQVEGVSDRDRAEAWKRIKAAAKKHDVEIEAGSWRELMRGGKTARR